MRESIAKTPRNLPPEEYRSPFFEKKLKQKLGDSMFDIHIICDWSRLDTIGLGNPISTGRKLAEIDWGGGSKKSANPFTT